MQRRGGTRGFTLVEVLIVIVILGILTTIAIPIFSRDMPRRYLKATSRDMYSALMKAKSEAIMRRTPVAVRINPKKDEFECKGTGCNWLQGMKDDDRISYVMFTVPLGGSVKKQPITVDDKQFIEKSSTPDGIVLVGKKNAAIQAGEGSNLYYSTIIFDERGIPKQLKKGEPKSAQGCVALCVDTGRRGNAADADKTTCRTIKISGGGAVSILNTLPKDGDTICKGLAP